MNAETWIDHISNDVEVRAMLPDGLPLNDLLFLGASIQPGNILMVETLTKSMPAGVPKRWVERDNDFVSITFQIGFRTATISALETVDGSTVGVVLTAGAFSLSSNEVPGAAALQIDAKTFFVRVELKPMQHAQLHP